MTATTEDTLSRRVRAQLVEAAGPARMTEAEIAAALAEFRGWLLAADYLDLWKRGRVTLGWDGRALTVRPVR